MSKSADQYPPAFERSARRDGRYWLALVFGGIILAFAEASGGAEACRVSGGCPDLLTAALRLIAGMFIAFSVGLLWLNGRRGSRFDPETGEFEWWRGRRNGDPGKGGRIDPALIGRIKIIKQDDRDDEVHLFDTEGRRLAYFDAEVVPWQQEQRAERFVSAFPHIAFERE